jgi:hypothetical protein
MKTPRKPSPPSEESSTKSPRVKNRGSEIARLSRTAMTTFLLLFIVYAIALAIGLARRDSRLWPKSRLRKLIDP